jgi:CRISPR-associated protein Cas1
VETREDEPDLQVPLIHLSGLVVFGDVLVTPAVVARFMEDGRSIVFLSRSGRFVGRMHGPTTGNVLLRQAQYRSIDDQTVALRLARDFVAGKVQNSRDMVLRRARDTRRPSSSTRLRAVATDLATMLPALIEAPSLDAIRGIEGEAARAVFGVFNELLTSSRETFAIDHRTRRPPLDRTNCLLSFLYALLRADCSAALEAVGLDPQAGFLHALRPGRPALALDLMEEFRPVLGDRLALTLINREQIDHDDFEVRRNGAVSLTDEGRKKVVVAYQKRKADEVPHAVLKQDVPLGLVPHLQARLIARFLRGDVPAYVPFRLK